MEGAVKKTARWAGVGLVALLGLGAVGSLLGDPAPTDPLPAPTVTIQAVPTWTPTVSGASPVDPPTATPTQPVEAAAATDTPLPVITPDVLPILTDTPLPPATATLPAILGSTVTGAANLRGGPGTGYAVVGSASQGQAVEVVGRTADNQWYQLAGGAWIYGELVDGVAAETPVVTDIPALPVQAVPATAVPAPPVSQPATPAPVIIPTSPPAPVAGPCSCGGDLYNCSDFGTHNQAQACFDYCVSQSVGDIHRLDGADGDSLACESLP